MMSICNGWARAKGRFSKQVNDGYFALSGKGEAHMTTAKPKATHVPAFIDPPPVPLPGIDDPALLGEWIAFRDDMDELEASLSIDHPELDWTDAMRPFKDEADTAIRTLTTANKLPRRED